MQIKILFMLLLLLVTSCRLQLNVASSVIYVPVTKLQLGENDMKTESSLKDLTSEQKAKLDGKLK